jgi:fructose-specific phosphotransferase system IIA component
MAVPVDFGRLFRPETVTLDLDSQDKESAIATLVGILAEAGDIPDRNAALEAVLDRERKMSTGMQHGIAIPHGKTDSVRDIVAAVGVHRKGLEFQSLDGKPTHIVIVTVSPQAMSGQHVQFLAQLGTLLSDQAARDRLLHARTPEAAIGILTAQA